MSPTKVTPSTVVPANPTHVCSPLLTAVCATRMPMPVSTAIERQSRYRLMKDHGASGGDVILAPEARSLVSTSRFTTKSAVASSSGTKLHKQGRYKLMRQASKPRRRRQDSVHSKRHDVQSKYKLVRHHSSEVAIAAGDVKLINTDDGTLEPDDMLSFGAHANRFTLTEHPLKMVRQNHDVVSAKRHVVLSKYKLVRPGMSVTSLRRTASKNKLVKKAASGSSWVSFRSFYNPGVLRSRKERQRHIKSPASWKKRYSIRRNSTGKIGGTYLSCWCLVVVETGTIYVMCFSFDKITTQCKTPDDKWSRMNYYNDVHNIRFDNKTRIHYSEEAVNLR